MTLAAAAASSLSSTLDRACGAQWIDTHEAGSRHTKFILSTSIDLGGPCEFGGALIIRGGGLDNSGGYYNFKETTFFDISSA